jgi:immunity protein Imm1 of predicted polymorphic toxin system
VLAADEDHWLGIAGGGEIGVYLVSATVVDTFYLAVTPSAPAEDVWLVAGGQGSDRPLCECVRLDAALRAARTYALDGSLDSSLTWDLT